ncbi:MAG: bifunctional demethylmenaquinone methyltransferase/2-methoxy-6-polyprenyl-1,4-benzoquinol methylase UbiE [Prevotellaceae bacterium]|jgi:demethylmenaquinone methyltransferase/2-methoxy-6-polyprenyl-1,4-benzoquinol methylase|nr:bifunctional demethylmenaquinone methyltransferase/2-methoxy-6-polyprenyl-1,4-benzoquinol methylase UbiE [Prevotellaceae bacterium]
MRKEKTAEMFNSIASKYDFLNSLFSLRIDKLWRRKLRKMLDCANPAVVLDVATGTADLAIECVKKKKKKIIGIDISNEMLELGRKKIEKKNLCDHIELLYGDSENLNFESSVFDAVTIAFGLRNFENREKALREIHRVTKPSGKLFILDFSIPENPLVCFPYRFYFFKIMPLIGKLISGNSMAYKYLPNSVSDFPQYEKMIELLNRAGYKKTEYKPLTFGIATIYCGEA